MGDVQQTNPRVRQTRWKRNQAVHWDHGSDCLSLTSKTVYRRFPSSAGMYCTYSHSCSCKGMKNVVLCSCCIESISCLLLPCPCVSPVFPSPSLRLVCPRWSSTPVTQSAVTAAAHPLVGLCGINTRLLSPVFTRLLFRKLIVATGSPLSSFQMKKWDMFPSC